MFIAGAERISARTSPASSAASANVEASSSSSGILAKVAAYVALTKPRIIELLLMTTVPTMIVAKRGMPSVALIFFTMVGGMLAAGGANAMNMWFDRDIDAVMKRTRKRPLVRGVISARNAVVFAATLEVLAVVWLALLVNPLSAALALSAALFYVFVYTIWLKRSSTNNIVIGGAAGAVPVLVGWSSVTDSLGWAPVIMFMLMFCWTPPHFWSLAYKYRDEYRAAHVPMLPVVDTLENTAKHILAYTIAVIVLSLVVIPFTNSGIIYAVAATSSGAVFIAYATRLLRHQSEKTAMTVFHFSITYVSILFTAMALDQLIKFS